VAVDLVPLIATLAKACLCEALAIRPNPPALCCYRPPGDGVMDFSLYEDMCCHGLAYVQVGDMWPSADSFPEQDINRQAKAKCAPPSWGFEVKIGVLRCVPVIGPTENEPPTCEQYETAFLQALSDSAALRAAACCFLAGFNGTLDPQLDGMSFVIGRMTGGQTQGACSDRNMSFQIQIPSACDGC
jgi:hypothetical protein